MSQDPTTTVAFQGAPGANSDLACRTVYPDWTPLPCETFEDVFEAVAAGAAARAMIPIENNRAGRVADIHNLLPEADLHIIAEHFQPVSHCLLALPGTPLSQVKRAHSHVMALSQCRHSLKRMGLKSAAAADTAGAAREVAALGEPSEAAIASALAAEIYGLDVVARNIEDSASNVTRFIIMAPEPAWPAQGATQVLTTVLFQLRSVPAALYKCLGGFATNGCNLTKLESYLIGDHFSAAQFYLDVEGHPDDVALAHALDELRYFSTDMRVLGVYARDPFRDTFPGE